HMHPLPPTPTLFPYTTLFRSLERVEFERQRLRVVVDVDAQAQALLRDRAVENRSGESAAEGNVANQALGASPAAGSTSATCSPRDRKSTRLNSSHSQNPYAVF